MAFNWKQSESWNRGTRIKAPRTKAPRTKTPRIKAPRTKSPPDKNPAGRKPLRIKAPRIKAPLNNNFSENSIDFLIFNSWWNFEHTQEERVLCKNIRIFHDITNIIRKILWLRISISDMKEFFCYVPWQRSILNL